MAKRFYTRAELTARSGKVQGKLERGMYVDAYKNGMSLSAMLEKMDPSDESDSMDAFERQMALSGIRTKSDPTKNIFADKVENFYASDQPTSIVLFPEFINRQMRINPFAENLLGEMVALNTPVDGDTYRSIYVDMSDLNKFRMKRVTEGSDVPSVTLKSAENSVTLYKHGVKLHATAEAIRRMRIDQLTIHLGLIGLQNNLDKASAALDVIINGDGNNNGAVNYNNSTMDSTTAGGQANAGKLTYKSWINFLMQFYPFHCTTIAGNKDALLAIMTMQFPGVDPLMALAQYVGGAPMNVQLANNVFVSVRLLLLDSAPANVLTGMDNRFALEMLTETGATMTETDKIITSQFTDIVLTDVTGFDKLYVGATKTLTLNA